MTCARCHDRPRYLGEYCEPCRALLLGDTDPWPFRDWGPLVDLRSRDDLDWILARTQKASA